MRRRCREFFEIPLIGAVGVRRTEQSFLPEDDPATGKVIRREFYLDLVAGEDADEVFAHFAGDVAEDLAGGAALVKAELEHGVGQRGSNSRFDFDRFRFGQGAISRFTRMLAGC